MHILWVSIACWRKESHHRNCSVFLDVGISSLQTHSHIHAHTHAPHVGPKDIGSIHPGAHVDGNRAIWSCGDSIFVADLSSQTVIRQIDLLPIFEQHPNHASQFSLLLHSLQGNMIYIFAQGNSIANGLNTCCILGEQKETVGKQQPHLFDSYLRCGHHQLGTVGLISLASAIQFRSRACACGESWIGLLRASPTGTSKRAEWVACGGCQDRREEVDSSIWAAY